MHISKPFVAYGLDDGLVICNYEDEGKRVVEVKEEGFSVSRILFLESHQAIATFTSTQDSK